MSRPKEIDISTELGIGILPVTRPRVKDRASLQMAAVFQSVSLVLDIASVFLAFWLAYILRYRLQIGGRIAEGVSETFSTFGLHALIASIILLVVFPTRGVYQIRHRLALIDYVPRVVGGYGIVLSGVILLGYFFQFSPSRLVYIYAGVIGAGVMLVHRWLTWAVRRASLRRGIGVDRVVVAGSGENARRLMHAMLGHVDLGFNLLGYVSERDSNAEVRVATERGVLVSPRLGCDGDIGRIVQEMRVDEVIIVGEGRHPSEIVRLVEQCREHVVQFRVVPDLLQISLDRVDISDINGVPTLGIRDASIGGWNAVLKRSMDILLSAVGFVILVVPMAVIAIMIKRDSEGDVLFRQTRLGQNGTPFTMYKFRCMVSDADQKWSELVGATKGADRRLFKDPDDPRLTRVGKVLRKLSLDELPQLWNVLRGDMSLVGPRPPLAKEVVEYDPWQRQRLLVRPGLTGLWQINGRSDLSFDEMVHLDLYYAENWSAWLDIKILLRTIPAVLLRRGAY